MHLTFLRWPQAKCGPCLLCHQALGVFSSCAIVPKCCNSFSCYDRSLRMSLINLIEDAMYNLPLNTKLYLQPYCGYLEEKAQSKCIMII